MVAAGSALAAACGAQAEADTASTQGAAATAAEAMEVGRVINVEVMSVATAPFTELVRVTGAVQANRIVDVAAEEAGVVRAVFAEKGARVSAGDSLARIDDVVLRAQLAQAKAQSDLATAVWERTRRLYDEDKVGTEMAYLEARYNAEQSKANHDVLVERLKRTVVRAPISGLLDARPVEVGSMVSGGSLVGRVVQLDTVKIAGGVPERFAPDIRLGTAVKVTFDVMPDRVFNGRVQYVGASVNPRNRTFTVELSLANDGLTVKPEMVANIELVRRTMNNVVSLPQQSLVRVENGYVVFVVETGAGGATRAVAKAVETGAAQRNSVTITLGINPGDQVVVVGQGQLSDGDRVKVVGTSNPSTGGDGGSR
jgi:membrane fusion protein (multidrug efflux system)